MMNRPFEKLTNEELAVVTEEAKLTLLNVQRELGRRGLDGIDTTDIDSLSEQTVSPENQEPCSVELLSEDQVVINGIRRNLFKPDAYHHLGKVRRGIWEVFINNPDRDLFANDFTRTVKTENLAPAIRYLADRLVDGSGNSIITITQLSLNQNKYRLRENLQISDKRALIIANELKITRYGNEFSITRKELELLLALVDRSEQQIPIEELSPFLHPKDLNKEASTEDQLDIIIDHVFEQAERLNSRLENLIEITETTEGDTLISIGDSYNFHLIS